jgi:hypothetical protein
VELKKSFTSQLTQPKATHNLSEQFSAIGRRARRGGATGCHWIFARDLSPDCRPVLMKVYTAKAAAEMMQICTETLRRLVREGAQHRRVGRRILFTEADVAAMLESKLMTGAVNPYARKQKQQTENTNEQQQPSNESDGGSTVATDNAAPIAAA